MSKPLHAVVETPEFLRKVQGLLSDDERAALVDWLAAPPTAGDLIVGTGGARKLRWAAKGSLGNKRIDLSCGTPSKVVIAGLDPAIHRRRTRGVALHGSDDRRDPSEEVAGCIMDRLVKPGDDKRGVARGTT